VISAFAGAVEVCLVHALLMMGLFGVIAGLVTGRASTIVAAFVGVLLLPRYAGHGLVEPRVSWTYCAVPAASFAGLCALGVALRRLAERALGLAPPRAAPRSID
jgi:hypothetical protein